MTHSILFGALASLCARSWEAPVIDLSCFGDHPGDKCGGEASKLLRAASESGGGAFVLRGHGVDDDFIDSVLSSARRLFTDVDASEKERLSIIGDGLTRGYVPLGRESGSDREEIKEAFSYGYDWPEGHKSFANKLQGPNVWPAGISAEDKRVLNEWFGHATRLGLSLARAFSSALVYREFFDISPWKEMTVQVTRLLEAPLILIGDSSLSFSRKRGVDGLEVQDSETGRYHPLPNDRASRMVVNVGDFASIMSGGKLHSPVHRVVSPKKAAERISLVHFYYPNYNTTLEGLLDTDAAERTSLLADQKAGGVSGWIAEDGHMMAFGDFISAKWSQVYRPRSRPDEEL
ncbi:hypothetical protein FOZ60_002947 [Perkinsus olseni]|uniref:Uncharacterized protein n=1 Tax=Perkinsus olseni TaxID=32597 RepID=A0A7J6NWT7_PEROL|nr:hypothetical protein FOZ60_002947 [Perkinsus olseni]